jgi:energy-coupling factor transporter ATP-binding protein EcfA2
VALTERDLLSHVLILGSTGSGKTTLLTEAMHQLVSHRSSTSVGLLVFDPKVDETVSLVRTMARAAGREDDVVVLGPEGDHYLDLFARLRSLEDVGSLTRRLLAGTQDMGFHNAFFNEARYAMIEAALTLLVAKPTRITFDGATEFLRSWFFNLRSSPAGVTLVVERARRFLKNLPATAPAAIRRQLSEALDQVALWQELDARTRSNVQSCLINALRPLLGVTAARCFESSGRPEFNPAQIATHGKLCVVSINALAEPQLAQLLFRLVRQDLFEAVQRRQGSGHRLCGVIADEFPLVALREDVEQLATIRAKRCFVIAAAQGLSGMDERLGPRGRRAALLNFNTVFLLRTREEETMEFAFISLGMRRESSQRERQDRADGSILIMRLPAHAHHESVLRPVCPPGTLGCLEPHQAFVLFADGRKTEHPIWLVPWFEDPSFPKSKPIRATSRRLSARKVTLPDPTHVHQLMSRQGRKPLWTPAILMAVAELCRPARPAASIVAEAIDFFRSKACRVPRGLKNLPLCWLVAIPHILWSLRRPHWPHVPFMLDAFAQHDGVLLAGFAQETQVDPHAASCWDDIRLALNCSVYPSLWRPLQRHHFVELWVKRPDLRPALQTRAPEIE